MLKKLVEVKGDFSNLKSWEKRSFKAYQIEKIIGQILRSTEEEQKELIRNHILSDHPTNFGASCIDIYLVAFVTEMYGKGKDKFFNYIRENGISDQPGSAQAIWQVGKGDGVFLNILNNDGTIKDWNFIVSWVKGKTII